MLRLLIDEQLSPDIASAVQKMQPRVEVVSLHYWEDRQYIGNSDERILTRSYERGVTLVTYDLKTIPPLLVRWGERGVPHAGVIFGDDHTVPPDDIGGVARALARLWQEQGELDWTNRIAYLRRVPEQD